MNVLMLDAGYSPIAIINHERAVKLFYSGKAEIIDSYDRTIHSPSVSMKVPSIIKIYRIFKFKKLLFKLNNKQLLYNFYRSKCAYCGIKVSYKKSTIDHLVAKSKGGTENLQNLILSCYDCNQKKGSKSLEESGLSLNNKINCDKDGIDISKFINVPDSWSIYI